MSANFSTQTRSCESWQGCEWEEIVRGKSWNYHIVLCHPEWRSWCWHETRSCNFYGASNQNFLDSFSSHPYADSQPVPLSVRPERKLVCIVSTTCPHLDPCNFARRASVFHPQSMPWWCCSCPNVTQVCREGRINTVNFHVSGNIISPFIPVKAWLWRRREYYFNYIGFEANIVKSVWKIMHRLSLRD